MRKGNSSNFQLFLRYTNIRTRGENEIIQCRIPPSGPPHLKIQIHSHCRQQDAGTNEEMFPLVPLVARRRLQTSKKCLIRRATLSSRLRSCGQCLSGVTVTGDPDEVKSEDQRQRCHLLSHPDCPPAPSTVALRSSLPVVRVCSAASMSTPAASVVRPSPSPTRRLTVASPSASSQPAQRRRQAKRARTFVRARVE